MSTLLDHASRAAKNQLEKAVAKFKGTPSGQRHYQLFGLACAGYRAGYKTYDDLRAFLEQIYKEAVGNLDDQQLADLEQTAQNVADNGDDLTTGENKTGYTAKAEIDATIKGEEPAWRKWVAGMIADAPEVECLPLHAEYFDDDEAREAAKREWLARIVGTVQDGQFVFCGGKRSDKHRNAYLDERLKSLTEPEDDLFCPNLLTRPERKKDACAGIRYLLLEIDEDLTGGHDGNGLEMANDQYNFWLAVREKYHLPIRTMVFSGSKSVHCLIPIADAKTDDLDQFRERLTTAYWRLHLDAHNIDCVRKSRTPWGIRSMPEKEMVALQWPVFYDGVAAPIGLDAFCDILEAMISQFENSVNRFEAALTTHKDILATYANFCDYLDWKGAKIATDDITRNEIIHGFDCNDLNTIDNQIRDDWAKINGKIPAAEKMLANINQALKSNRENPVVDWIRATAWDGADRIGEIFDILGLQDDFSKLLVRKWLIQTAAMLHNGEDGRKYGCDGVLTLLGKQGIGKTSFFKGLVPQEKQTVWFGEGCSLDTENTDSLRQLTRWWIMELGEVDDVTKKEQSQLKAKLTAASDTIRAPYDRVATTTLRHCSVCASVNKQDYLHDDTGNRRWWSVTVEKIDLDRLAKMDTQQLWAQCESIWQTSDKDRQDCFRLTADEREQLNEKNTANLAQIGYEEQVIRAFPKLADRTSLKKATLTFFSLEGAKDRVLGSDRFLNKREKTDLARTLLKMGASRKISRGIWYYGLPEGELEKHAQTEEEVF